MKFVSAFLLFAFCFLLAGCSKKSASNEVVDSKSKEVFSKHSKSSSKIDIDFTKMDYDMVSSQIFNIQVESERYLGKRIKIKGQFYSSQEEGQSRRNYSVLLWDSNACCQTGLQFTPKESRTYPQDFPEEMSDLQITGILRLKEVNGFDYLYIESEDF